MSVVPDTVRITPIERTVRWTGQNQDGDEAGAPGTDTGAVIIDAMTARSAAMGAGLRSACCWGC
jgi:hypothetical protein